MARPMCSTRSRCPISGMNEGLANMKLCVHICAEKEWPCIKSILNYLGNKVQCSPFGEYFDRLLGPNECIWYHSGATKTRAAAACQYAIDVWHPDAIINLGTCGGVDQNVKELEIILANRTIQYDVIQRFGIPEQTFEKDKETLHTPIASVSFVDIHRTRTLLPRWIFTSH